MARTRIACASSVMPPLAPTLSQPLPLADVILLGVNIKVDGRLWKTSMERIAGIGTQLPQIVRFNGESTLIVDKLV